MYDSKKLGDNMLLGQIKGVSGELDKLQECKKEKSAEDQAKHDAEIERVSVALQDLIAEAKARGIYRKERAKEKAEKKGKHKRGMTGGSPNAQPVAVKGKKAKGDDSENPNKE